MAEGSEDLFADARLYHACMVEAGRRFAIASAMAHVAVQARGSKRETFPEPSPQAKPGKKPEVPPAVKHSEAPQKEREPAESADKAAANHSGTPQMERASAGSAAIAAAESRTRVPVKAMECIPEEPEPEESTEPPPRGLPHRNGTGSASGKQEAQRSLGKDPAGQAKDKGKAAKNPPGSSGKKAGPEQRKVQPRTPPAKTDRSVSTGDLSEEIRRTDSRRKYLAKQKELKAVKEREIPKRRSREQPKDRRDGSRSSDEYSGSYYSDETESSYDGSPTPARKCRKISLSRARRSRSQSPVRRSESPVYDPRRSRSPRSRSRRKEPPRLTPPPPWRLEEMGASA